MALISRLENERANISNIRNPLNILYGTKAKYTRQINYLKKLLKNQRPENIILEKKKQENNNELSKLQSNSKLNFIPIELEQVEKNREIMLAASNVATEVLHINSKNVSDPYRQLTSNYYGIYV